MHISTLLYARGGGVVIRILDAVLTAGTSSDLNPSEVDRKILGICGHTEVGVQQV